MFDTDMHNFFFYKKSDIITTITFIATSVKKKKIHYNYTHYNFCCYTTLWLIFVRKLIHLFCISMRLKLDPKSLPKLINPTPMCPPTIPSLTTSPFYHNPSPTSLFPTLTLSASSSFHLSLSISLFHFTLPHSTLYFSSSPPSFPPRTSQTQATVAQKTRVGKYSWCTGNWWVWTSICTRVVLWAEALDRCDYSCNTWPSGDFAGRGTKISPTHVF